MDVAKHSLSFEGQDGSSNRAIINARLTQLCGQLESIEMDANKTAATRGAIQELRRLLAPAMPVMTGLQYSGMVFKTKGAE